MRRMAFEAESFILAAGKRHDIHPGRLETPMNESTSDSGDGFPFFKNPFMAVVCICLSSGKLCPVRGLGFGVLCCAPMRESAKHDNQR